jgi:hypothetical protein
MLIASDPLLLEIALFLSIMAYILLKYNRSSLNYKIVPPPKLQNFGDRSSNVSSLRIHATG